MNNRIALNCRHLLKTVLAVMVILPFTAGPLYSQSDTISGVVVTADGTPMAGIPVKAMPDGTNSAALHALLTKTDDSGRYLFEGVPPGTYTLHAEPEGGSGKTLRAEIVTFVRVSATCDLATGKCSPSGTRSSVPFLRGTASVTVPDKASTGVDVVVLPSAFTVSGHLTVPSGMTLPELRASLVDMSSERTTDTVVHSDGTFEISNVPPGTYVLRIIPNLGMSSKTITVKDHNESGIELGGKNSGVRVSGYVQPADRAPYQNTSPQWVYLVGQDATDRSPSSQGAEFMRLGLAFLSVSGTAGPKPPAPIIFADESGAAIEAPFAPVGPEGRFEFLSVRPGKYYLHTLPEMGIPNTAITVGDADVNDLRTGAGVRVRGEIVPLNLGTRPPELINLTATEFKGQSVSAAVNADGSFEFPKVGPGTFRILLDDKIRPKPSEITIGDEDLIFRVEAPFKAVVTGRVVFAGSIPPPEILSDLRAGMNNGYDSDVKPDGSFQIKSNEGEYEFFLKNLPEECIVKSISDGIGNLMIEPVKVDLSSPPREILVTLEYKPALKN